VVEVRIGHRIHSVLHPLYIRIHRARDNTSSEDDDGEWIEAERLRIGDEIRRAKGDWAKVEPVTQRNDCAKKNLVNSDQLCEDRMCGRFSWEINYQSRA
jgi:hypothetical protein